MTMPSRRSAVAQVNCQHQITDSACSMVRSRSGRSRFQLFHVLRSMPKNWHNADLLIGRILGHVGDLSPVGDDLVLAERVGVDPLEELDARLSQHLAVGEPGLRLRKGTRLPGYVAGHPSFQQFPGYQHVLFRCKQIFNLVPIAVTFAVWTGISWRVTPVKCGRGDGGSVYTPSCRAHRDHSDRPEPGEGNHP
jgi:hypothetical protein